MIDPTILGTLAPLVGIAIVVPIGGWIVTTWLRVRHGYPLDDGNGGTVEPTIAGEARERIKLLSSENAQLRAEIGSVKDRLAVVERIVTDRAPALAEQIDRLRSLPPLN